MGLYVSLVNSLWFTLSPHDIGMCKKDKFEGRLKESSSNSNTVEYDYDFQKKISIFLNYLNPKIPSEIILFKK
jgi:hypothetical protein